MRIYYDKVNDDFIIERTNFSSSSSFCRVSIDFQFVSYARVNFFKGILNITSSSFCSEKNSSIIFGIDTYFMDMDMDV